MFFPYDLYRNWIRVGWSFRKHKIHTTSNFVIIYTFKFTNVSIIRTVKKSSNNNNNNNKKKTTKTQGIHPWRFAIPTRFSHPTRLIDRCFRAIVKNSRKGPFQVQAPRCPNTNRPKNYQGRFWGKMAWVPSQANCVGGGLSWLLLKWWLGWNILVKNLWINMVVYPNIPLFAGFS